MAEIDVSLPVAAQPSVDTLVEQARDAEDRGVNRVWLPETWGRDAVTVLTSIAHATDTVGIGSSIVNVYSRSPALLGQTAATLQEVSDGRFRLGLGPSGPVVIENWHGVPFDRPLRRTRECVEVVKQVLSGDVVDYDGDVFDLSGFRLRCDPPSPTPSVDVTGMGPKAVELAGRFADGWHGLMLTPDGLRERLDVIERGADLGDRSSDDVRTMLSVTCLASDDGDRARDLVRQHLAFYVGSMGTFYRDSLARQGYEDVADEIYDSWQSGDREAALDAIDDDVLGELGVAGTPETVREGIESWLSTDGLDAVCVSFPRAATPEDVSETVAAVEPLL